MIAEKHRPNILLLFTDQQRFDTIAAAGYSHMKTPNIDRLVNEGCLFTNAYTPNPVCVPARYCMLTGVTETQHNIVNNGTANMAIDGLPTLPGVLADHGYFTAAVGKMHFTPPRNHHGFLEMHLMEEIPGHRCDDAYAEWLEDEGLGKVRTLHGSRPLLYHEPQKAMVDAEHHGTEWVAKRTIEVIDRNAGRRPFFIQTGWIKPHPPWNIPEEWRGLYDDADLPAPIPGPRMAPNPTGESAWFGDDDSTEKTMAVRAAYYTTISMLDAAVGKILDHLEEKGILDDTLIIFSSDHGEMLRDHGLYQKMQPYESASHIPFIIRYPKHFSAGSREEKFVDLLDIMPTAFDAAGIDVENIRSARAYEPAGSSLLRLNETGGRDRTIQRSSHNELQNRWVMLRDQRYKYVHYSNGGMEWFFDLEKDPCELRNLVGTDELPQADYERLKGKCVNEEERLGLEGGVVNGQLFEREHDVWPNPKLCGKFPGWANNQMPEFGNLDADEEAQLLAEQIKQALAWANDGAAGKVITEPLWYDHFLDSFREHGVSEAKISEIREFLKIP